jgi:hypothetical protein
MIDAETIRVWRINYGLDTRTPAEAMRWWDTQVGHAPPGAVAALGICLDEIERLRARHVALVCPQCSWTLEPSERREG